MPTMAMASHYWPGDGIQGPQPVAAVRGGHPYMFDGTLLGAGFGFLHSFRLPVPRQRYWWEHYVKRAKGSMIKLFRRVMPGRLIASVTALRLIWSSDWSIALKLVKDVAVAPESRDFKSWADIDREAVQVSGVAENTWRGLLAAVRFHQARPQLHKQKAELLLELAYGAFKVKRK